MKWRYVLRRRILSAVPTDCPMCGGPARGGRLCAGCQGDVVATMRAGQPRCARCALRLRSADSPCPDCARRPLPLERVVAGFDYESPGDMLITRYKIELRYALAEVLADLILYPPGGTVGASFGASGDARNAADAGAGTANDVGNPGCGGILALPEDTVLVPIPSSRASLRRRGFSPAAELARALGHRTGLPVQQRWLARGREGPKQSGLTRAARLRGATGGYFCPGPVPPRTIALVDDVMTTGSTLCAAALALRAAGADRVIGLVAARAPADDGGTLAQYRLPQ